MHKVIIDGDIDRERRGVGVPHDVADRFTHDGFGMIGERGVDNRQRAGVLDGRAKVRTGELRNRVVKPLAQPGDARGRAVQVEDCGTDLVNDLLQLVDALRESLLHFWDPGPRYGPL